MSLSTRANDWQCVCIAQVGVGALAAAGVYAFEFRSRNADYRGVFSFGGVGAGIGGSLGGSTAPSPSDVAHNRNPDLWTSLRVRRPFSANDLNHSFAGIESAGASAIVGYSLVTITAGFWDILFYEQDVSGWGIGGLGLSAVNLTGMWFRANESRYYV